MLWDNGRLQSENSVTEVSTKAIPFPSPVPIAQGSWLPAGFDNIVLYDNSDLVAVRELGYGATRFPDMRQTLLVIPPINTLAKRLRMAQHR
jgi:hypothetical protein